MIDNQGFRANVGIIITNSYGQVFWGRRVGQNAWQFPQGGLNPNESLEDAMYRELFEETGLQPDDVDVLASTNGWLRYRLPKRMIRHGSNPLCIGQKQKWFLLHYKKAHELGEQAFQLDRHQIPEFDEWQWVSYWYPINQVISFKREVYRRALKELSPSHTELVRGSQC